MVMMTRYTKDRYHMATQTSGLVSQLLLLKGISAGKSTHPCPCNTPIVAYWVGLMAAFLNFSFLTYEIEVRAEK